MRRVLALACFFGAPLLACASSSGVDGKLPVNSLSDSDWKRYCNWFNGEVAGNVGKSCPGGSLLPNSQLDCAGKNPAGTCASTVSQVESCVRKFKDTACDGLDKVFATSDCNGVTPSCKVLFVGSNFN